MFIPLCLDLIYMCFCKSICICTNVWVYNSMDANSIPSSLQSVRTPKSPPKPQFVGPKLKVK